MSKEELKEWLSKQPQDFSTIIKCPRCGKLDVAPRTHADNCDPDGEAYRQESQDYYD